MSSTSDQHDSEISTALLQKLREKQGGCMRYRPAHAKGQLVRGFFSPTVAASRLSKAQHFNKPSTSVLVRFSVSTGTPTIADTDDQAAPRGMAIRFFLDDEGHKYTDIIGHSIPHFPVSTGEGFLQLLSAFEDGTIGEFLTKHPAAMAFVAAPRPSPVSFATEPSYGLHAFKLVAEDGRSKFVRYEIIPGAGAQSETDLSSKSDSYLAEELKERLKHGAIYFHLYAQIAEEGDITNNVTVHWPQSREKVLLGVLQLHTLLQEPESSKEQARIIFDPMPRVEGIEASDDPIIQTRTNVYHLSGRQRRESIAVIDNDKESLSA